MISLKRKLSDLSEEEFSEILNNYLMPSSPIRREELLKGRHKQLEQVRKALMSPGRSVFIHGMRGVGKTSLAQTAASLFQSSDADPILTGCDKTTTFAKCIGSICSKLIYSTPDVSKKTQTKKFGFSYRGLSAEQTELIEKGRIPAATSVDEAISFINYCSTSHSRKPVVIIDEFDRIEDKSERTYFGDFIKQVGDQSINTKFILCGVGESVKELLAEHESAFRYFASIRLERLGIDPCMEIIESAAEQVGVEIDRNYLLRAAWISDGFPHFTHLIGFKLLWNVFEDVGTKEKVTAEQFTSAIESAVEDVEQHLKILYDKATKKYGDDYQYVLWAAADHPDTERRSSDIWESYSRIMKDLDEPAISRDLFNNRMNSLKQRSHGNVLSGTRTGWYKFTNPMLRGYCRLKAQTRDVILGREHFLEEEKRLRKI